MIELALHICMHGRVVASKGGEQVRVQGADPKQVVVHCAMVRPELLSLLGKENCYIKTSCVVLGWRCGSLSKTCPHTSHRVLHEQRKLHVMKTHLYENLLYLLRCPTCLGGLLKESQLRFDNRHQTVEIAYWSEYLVILWLLSIFFLSKVSAPALLCGAPS